MDNAFRFAIIVISIGWVFGIAIFWTYTVEPWIRKLRRSEQTLKKAEG